MLHLSDIHFGRYHEFNDASIKLQDVLGNHLRDHIIRQKPNICVISGDLASESRVSDYKQAKDFIHFIAKELKLSPNQMIIVPGNHDVARYEPEQQSRYDKYLAFINDCYNTGEERNSFLRSYLNLYSINKEKLDWGISSNITEDLFTVSHLTHNKVIIIGFNSTISNDAEYERGQYP